MGYEINKGADRPPQVWGIVGLPRMISFLKWVIGLVVGGGVTGVASPIPGWIVAAGVAVGIYLKYEQVRRQSIQSGKWDPARDKARKRLPGILIIRSASIYKNLRNQ